MLHNLQQGRSTCQVVKHDFSVIGYISNQSLPNGQKYLVRNFDYITKGRLQMQNSKMISALSNKWVTINEINAKILSPPVKNI